MGSYITKSATDKLKDVVENEKETVEITYSRGYDHYVFYIIIDSDADKLNNDLSKCTVCHKYITSKPYRYFSDESYMDDILHIISNDFFLTSFETSSCECLEPGETKESCLNYYNYIDIERCKHKNIINTTYVFNEATKHFDLIKGVDDFKICSL